MAGGAGSSVGTGGMRSKLDAARIAMRGGVPLFVGRVSESGDLQAAAAGRGKGTYFVPALHSLSAKKHWVGFLSDPQGKIIVDGGAEDALLNRGSSLLPAGITAAEGDFHPGEVVEVDRTLLDLLAKSEMIPVIAPVAPGRDGATYNINADTFAGAIAGALNATRLLFLTDVPGVLDRNKELIKELSVAEAKSLIRDGTISGGMIPKVETCIEAIEAGVQGVVILNGKTAHSVLLELFTEHGAGTLIVP